MAEALSLREREVISSGVLTLRVQRTGRAGNGDTLRYRTGNNVLFCVFFYRLFRNLFRFLEDKCLIEAQTFS